MSFVHLHVYSEYSLGRGLIKLDSLAEKVAANNMPAIAITELDNMFSAVKFYRIMLRHGIKPIIGAELYIQVLHDQQPSSVVLLCQHIDGFRNLCQLISKSYNRGAYHQRPIIHWEWLEALHEGLLILQPIFSSVLGEAFIQDNQTVIGSTFEQWLRLFGNRYYLALQRLDNLNQEDVIQTALHYAGHYEVPVVASHSTCFLEPQDYRAYETRVCIHEGHKLQDITQRHEHAKLQYLRSTEEMQELFADIPVAIENSLKIAQRCNVEFQFGQNFLPHFSLAEEETATAYLQKKVLPELDNFLKHQSELTEGDEAVYRQRLKHEMDIITSTGFEGYFLIVADFIDWAKREGIPVGPGRGSGAGSLIAFLLGITALDPIKYDLLFERFLNPERVSLPDFDIDFCMLRRDEVLSYVSEKYGNDYVAQIITYGTMAAKAVVRDVARVLGMPYSRADEIAKLIPFKLDMTLERAFQEEQALQRLCDQDEEVQTLFELARKLEGTPRNVGRHAGGIVIAPQPLHHFMPLYYEQGEQHQITQFDMNDVETVGLVKFDFLGLKTLTIIDWTVSDINQDRQAKGKPTIDIEQLRLDDRPTYQLLQTGNTTAIFQLESQGIRRLIKKLKPDSFDDLVALVALFRPGPLQSNMVDDFIERKHQKQSVSYPHEDLADVLAPTYGVIVYQEQVMQIAQKLANYSLGEADLLRRAMGKKNTEEMAKQRTVFVERAVARGVKEKQAKDIFELMEKFAEYGFNKSHSVAYALIAYQTAWLKQHFPSVFMAAVLSADMDNIDKLIELLKDLKTMGITVTPPDINHSVHRFRPLNKKEIIYGLGAIKGIGSNVADDISEQRNAHGDYKDLFDFCGRIKLERYNQRAFEALIYSGAMDSLGRGRHILMANISQAITLAEQMQRNASLGQGDIFGFDMIKQDDREAEYIQIAEWDKCERLAREKETLGFYLSGHPIDLYADELKQIISMSLDKLKPSSDQVTVAGYITAIKRYYTNKNEHITELSLEDNSAVRFVKVSERGYQKYQHLLQQDELLIMSCSVTTSRQDKQTLMLRANKIYTIDDYRNSHGTLVMALKQTDSNDIVGILKKIFQTHQKDQGAPVHIHYQNAHARAYIRLGSSWRLNMNDALLEQLSECLNGGQAMVRYTK